MAQPALATGYPLKRDHLAATRLNYLHFLTENQFGCLLHPSIPVEPGQEIHIADVASGTCVFATELALRYPDAKVVAFDVSSDQFPPSEWMPSNMTSQVQDAFASFPDQYIGAFDIVTIKYVISLVPGNGKKLLDNIVTLLKPGGYIQWIDGNPASYRIEAANSSVKHPAADKVINFLTRPEYHWIKNLDEHFPSSGLSLVMNPPIVHSKAKQSQWTLWTQMNLMALDEVIDRSGSVVNKDQLDVMMSMAEEFRAEVKTGVALLLDLVLVVGRLETI